MITVKDLFENEELMENIVEDIDDLPADAKVTYEVWALGYDAADELTDSEYLIGEFSDPDEAVQYANSFTLEELIEKLEVEYEKLSAGTAKLSIEVETVVEDPEDEYGGTMNIGTIYQRDLYLDGASEAAGLGDYNNVVCITAKDYELLEDGTLKVSCKFLRDFNKNDEVIFEFCDEPEASVLTYKIMSKVIYGDGDYYHCELML